MAVSKCLIHSAGHSLAGHATIIEQTSRKSLAKSVQLECKCGSRSQEAYPTWVLSPNPSWYYNWTPGLCPGLRALARPHARGLSACCHDCRQVGPEAYNAWALRQTPYLQELGFIALHSHSVMPCWQPSTGQALLQEAQSLSQGILIESPRAL